MFNGRRRFTATVMGRSALPDIDALPSCIAINKTPPHSGLSRSDFVLWHRAVGFRVATFRQDLGVERNCKLCRKIARVTQSGDTANGRGASATKEGQANGVRPTLIEE